MRLQLDFNISIAAFTLSAAKGLSFDRSFVVSLLRINKTNRYVNMFCWFYSTKKRVFFYSFLYKHTLAEVFLGKIV